MVGDSWVNTSSSSITDAVTSQVIPAGATATWTGDTWIISDKPTASGSTAPANPTEGQQWIDTSTTPAVLKVYHQYLNPQWVSISTFVTQGTDIGVANGATRNMNQGTYDSTKTYILGDIVTLVGNSWTCSVATSGNAPPTDSTTVSNTWWKLLAAKGTDGASVTIADLLSESDVVPADAEGKNYTLPTGNKLRLYIGATIQTANVTYSVSSAQSGLIAVIDPTGSISFSGTWTSDLAQFTFTATYFSVQYTAGYTIAKAKKGTNTVLVDIKSDADVIPAKTDGTGFTLPTGNAIVVYDGGTLVTNPVSGTAVISYSVAATPLNRLGLAIDNFGNITLNQSTGAWNSDGESFTINTTYKGITYTNIYTIAKAKAGAQGISTYLASVYYNGTPSGAPTGGSYNFSSNVFTGPTTAGWQKTPFAATTTGQYVSTQIFTSNNGGVSISWSTPVLYNKNGIDGNPGGPGTPGTSFYSATVYLQSLSTPSAPTGGSYTFGGTLTAPSGWSKTQPATTTTPTWSCEYTFSTTTAGATVNGGTWQNVKICAQNGTNGVSIKGDQGKSATRAFTLSTVGTPATITNYTTDGVTSLPASTANSWSSITLSPSNNQAQWQSDGIIDYVTQKITWGAPYLTVFKVDTLSAFTTNTGELNVTGNINMTSNSMAIRSGTAVTFGSAGYYMGLNASGKALLSIMADASNGIKYDGSTNTISLLGKIITSGNLATNSVLNDAIKAGEVSTASVATNAITNYWYKLRQTTDNTGYPYAVPTAGAITSDSFDEFTVTAAGVLEITIISVVQNKSTSTAYRIEGWTSISKNGTFKDTLRDTRFEALDAGVASNNFQAGNSGGTSGSMRSFVIMQQIEVAANDKIIVKVSHRPHASQSVLFVKSNSYSAVLYKR
jgi:hypothetical protein